MESGADLAAVCPFEPNRDERKSARLAAERVVIERGARVIGNFSFARNVLRSSIAKQAGPGSDRFNTDQPDLPVFLLDGEPHRRKRSALARFFTAKAVTTRYRAVMERTTEALISRMRLRGSARLDRISLQLAVVVAAEIIGLTNSGEAAMTSRIRRTLMPTSPNIWRWLAGLLNPLAARLHAVNFFYRDVRPAIKARRATRRDDIISHLIDQGYSDQAILIECMTYAVAGMVTTREFIVMAAWYLFERDALRERFLAADEDDQIIILEEILRLEPVASAVYRRATEQISDAGPDPIPAGTLITIDIRAANSDESVTGSCPHMLDPDRAKRMKISGGYMSFGYGNHRCPGSQVALHETRVFLDRLLRIPGIRLKRAPDIGWCEMLLSYELRDAIVSCERA
jgi:cytochrome P450